MIVPDTSAWVEYLRRTESPIDHALTLLIDERAVIATTEYVAMELLAGARTRTELVDLESLLMSCPLLLLNGMADYEEGAALYRACRSRGETIRKLGDCLVAVPVIREGAELLHNDSDFDAIARHSELRIYPVG